MSIMRNDIPILEFDSDDKAVIMPTHEQPDVILPEKCVFAFLGEYIDTYAKNNPCKKLREFISITKTFPVYATEYKGETLCLVQAPLGASAAAQFLDWLIGYGVKKIIACGSCGALIDFLENTILIPVKALRDEGTSYHYMNPSRFVEINRTALSAIEKTLRAHGIAYTEVITWSTDGFFRETKEKVLYRKDEGCSVVEMECAALAACAAMRKTLFAEILFTADTLSNLEKHDERNWGRDSHARVLQLCFESLIALA